MDIYLAQLPEEAEAAPGAAWLLCPFGPDFRLPEPPKEGTLIFTDSIAYSGQRPEDILQGKSALFACSAGLVLDFQRPATLEARRFVEALRHMLPCPVACPPEYAEGGPVFLPPLVPHIPPETQLEPWKGRDIWLDLSPCPTGLLLTAAGCREEPGAIPPEPGFGEEGLLCHYRIDIPAQKEVRFTLWRTRADLLALAQRPEVGHCIALRQEWEG